MRVITPSPVPAITANTAATAPDMAYKKRLQMGMPWIQQPSKLGEIAIPSTSLQDMTRLQQVSPEQANTWGAMQSALEQTGVSYARFQDLMSGILHEYLNSKGAESRSDLIAKITAGFTPQQRANFSAGYGDGSFYFPDVTPGGNKVGAAHATGLAAISGIAQDAGVHTQLLKPIASAEGDVQRRGWFANQDHVDSRTATPFSDIATFFGLASQFV